MASNDFHHGVEVIEVDDGIRPITTVRSSVIGVVGTAPDSAPEVKAALAVGSVASNNGVTLTAKPYGAAGNDITYQAIKPAANSAALSVVVTGRSIVVNLATGSTGAVTTTGTQLVAAIAANAAASALVTAVATGASTGAGIVPANNRAVYLAGGVDEPFPLNRPVLVVGDARKAAGLGLTGTLPGAMYGIFKQTGAVVVVVRVEEGTTPTDSMENVIGGVGVSSGKYTGVWSLLSAESAVGFAPKILIAPGWTHQTVIPSTGNPVIAELSAIATRMRAIAIKDGPSTNDAAAIADRELYGNKRVYGVESFVTILENGEAVNVPASSYVAGLIARVDNEEGYWVSPSNHEIYGIIGTERDIDYTHGDPQSRANLLNERDIAVIIRSGAGFRLWGNRTFSNDPKWSFLTRVRTSDMINEAILQSHLWAVDKQMKATYYTEVTDSVNDFMARLVTNGAIAGGLCWADPAANPPAEQFAGHAMFDYEFSDFSPAERVTFRSRVSDRFLEEVV